MSGTQRVQLNSLLDELKKVLILSGEGLGSSPSSQGWNFLLCGEEGGREKIKHIFPSQGRGTGSPLYTWPPEAKGALAFGEGWRLGEKQPRKGGHGQAGGFRAH